MQKSAVELVAALVSAGLSVFGFLEALRYSGQAGLMPQVVTFAAIILSLVWCGQSIVGMRSAEREVITDERPPLSSFAVIVAGIFIYVLAIPVLGFFTSTFLTVPILSFCIGYRNWRVSILATGCFVAIIYLVFRTLLNVPLPDELILVLMFGGG